MLRDTTIPAAQAWNTWSGLPAELVFLPLGVCLAPVSYAASTGTATLFPSLAQARPARHAIDGSLVELRLEHAGTELDWRYVKPTPFEVRGAWQARRLGEWGLRFWINLCLRAEGGEPVRYEHGMALVQVGTRVVALATATPPVQVTGHATLAAVAAQYEAAGYFDLSAQAREAPVLALRFNLEMTRDLHFALAVADSPAIAVARAAALLAGEAPAPALPAQSGRHALCLDAVRDVVAWNTVWDEANARPYTSISRNWNQAKFGGFGVWLNDQQYAAHLAGLFDPELARQNLAVALASATPQGNLACLLTTRDAWVDRTQLPVGSFLVWLAYLRGGGGRAVLALAFATLARNHRWWWANRDPLASGLCSFGTSDVGGGLYRGTSFGARNESSMDNAAHHDEAVYDPATRTLECWDVGLNSLLALDAEMLALIAAELGEDPAPFEFLAARTRERIRDELWDDPRGLFANRRRGGSFVRSVGPTSFYPLVAGAPTAAQAERLVAHLADPATFGGAFVIPGTSRDDPAFADNTYWRGRIWPPLNFWVWHGLRRSGHEAAAAVLVDRSVALFQQSWQHGLCPENYNAVTGAALDQPDTDGFYTWGALLPLLGVASVMDCNPWGGWEIVNAAEPATLGPLESPAGQVTIVRAGGRLTVTRGSRVLLATDVIGRIAHLELGAGLVRMELPPVAEAAEVVLPGIDPGRVVAVRLGDMQADWQAEAGGIAIPVPPDARRRRLGVYCA